MGQNLSRMIKSGTVGREVHIYFDPYAMLSFNFMEKFVPELFELIDNSDRGYSVVIHSSVTSFLQNKNLPDDKRKRNAKLLEFISKNNSESEKYYFQCLGSGNGIKSFVDFIVNDSKHNEVIVFSDGNALNKVLDAEHKDIIQYSLREYCLNRYIKHRIPESEGASFKPYRAKTEPDVKGFIPNPHIPVANEFVIIDGEQKKLIGKTGTTGAEASVYVVGDNLVAKIFKPSSIKMEKFKKLTLMVGVKIDNDNISWPKSIVYNSDGNPVGYTMSYIHAMPLSSLTNKLYFMEDGECELWERSDLVKCALKVAENIHELHSKGILFGDFSDNNILIDTQDPNNTNLIDVDDCFIDKYTCKHSTAGYRAPEVASGEKGMSYQTELFSLAIVLFDILMVTKDPYSSSVAYGNSEIDALVSGKFPFPKKGKDYKSANTRMNDFTDKMYDNMPQYIKDAFYETFAKGGSHFESNRISAKEWVALLNRYESDLAGNFGVDQNANLVLPNGYRSSGEPKTAAPKTKTSPSFHKTRHKQIKRVYNELKRSASPDTIVSKGKELNAACVGLKDKYGTSSESKHLERFVNKMALPLSNVSVNNPQVILEIMRIQELYRNAKAYQSSVREEVKTAESHQKKYKMYQSVLERMDEVLSAVRKVPQDCVPVLRAFGLNRKRLRVEQLVCKMELFTFLANDYAKGCKGSGEVRTHYDSLVEETYLEFCRIEYVDDETKEMMKTLYQTRKHNK